jgi:hypothetical protein
MVRTIIAMENPTRSRTATPGVCDQRSDANHAFQDRFQIVNHAELWHVSREASHDGLPHETDEQAHRERLPNEDGDEKKERAIGGAAEDGRDEESTEDVPVSPRPVPWYASVTP